MNAGEMTAIVYQIWNLVNFRLMGIEQVKEKHDLGRIPESTLLGGAFLMGAVGSILGSRVFHHKTQKKKFQIGLPAALLFNIAVTVAVRYFLF